MAKITVLGAGNIGRTAANYLDALGYNVLLADSSEQALESASKDITGLKTNLTLLDDNTTFKDVVSGTVLSCLPYHQNFEVAKFCIDTKRGYVDLGGSIEVTNQITRYYQYGQCASTTGCTIGNGSPLALNQGLAPGLINCKVWKVLEKFNTPPNSVLMAVGGLPGTNKTWWDDYGPLKYTLTWSVDGLINEYKEDCEILKNGEIQTVKALSGHDKVDEVFEMFRTSGGAADTLREMQVLGVKNCEYKTIRYHGHRDIINFLFNYCNLSNEKLKEIFNKACPRVRDTIYMLIKINDGPLEYREMSTINANVQSSAMARATAGPASAVVHCIENKKLAGMISYKSIASEPLFWETLKLMGI